MQCKKVKEAIPFSKRRKAQDPDLAFPEKRKQDIGQSCHHYIDTA
jgi:hypothetical protein